MPARTTMNALAALATSALVASVAWFAGSTPGQDPARAHLEPAEQAPGEEGLDNWSVETLPSGFVLQDELDARPAAGSDATVSTRRFLATDHDGAPDALLTIDVYHQSTHGEHGRQPWDSEPVVLEGGSEAVLETNNPSDPARGLRMLRWRADAETYVTILARGHVDDDQLQDVANGIRF